MKKKVSPNLLERLPKRMAELERMRAEASRQTKTEKDKTSAKIRHADKPK